MIRITTAEREKSFWTVFGVVFKHIEGFFVVLVTSKLWMRIWSFSHSAWIDIQLFDTLDHALFIGHLEHRPCYHMCSTQFFFFLNHQVTTIVVNTSNCFSITSEIPYGVPQGFFLGPNVFLYTSSLWDKLHVNTASCSSYSFLQDSVHLRHCISCHH